MEPALRILVDLGDVQDLRDDTGPVHVRDVFPERVSGITGILVLEVDEFFVFPRNDPILHPVLKLIVPGIGNEGDQSLQVPFRQVDHGAVGQVVPQTVSEHHFCEQHLGYRSPDLSLEFHMVPVKIEEYLVLNDLGGPPDVVLLVFGYQPDIALPEIRHLVIGKENEPSFDVVIEKPFDERQLLFHKIGHIKGEVCSVLVGIDIETVESVEFPVPVVELHPVFPEIHLHPVVKLGTGGQ